MTIASLFTPAISALRGQSIAFQTIAENITNQVTPGYKSADTRFREVLTQANVQTLPTYGGSRPNTQFFIDKQGTIETSFRAFDVAIQGKGFFISNTQRDKTGEFQLTRNGRMEVAAVDVNGDTQSYLTDVAGNFLLGWPADADGNFTTGSSVSSLVPMRIDRDAFVITAKATTTAKIQLVLPSDAKTGTSYTADVGIFDDNGEERNLKTTFTKNAAKDTWDVSFSIADGTVTSPSGTVTMTFDASGDIVSPTTQALTFTYTDGGTGSVSLDLSKITQYAGEFTLIQVSRNGNGQGELDSIEVDEDGVVIGNFSNGASRGIYKMPLAMVNSPNLLSLRNATHFAESEASGKITLVEADTTDQGAFVGAAIEQSTVDLAYEFTKMIAAQRSYSSAGNALRTINEMFRIATDLKQ